jgi:16S rRNA (guanine527-N7)-methyltransferase
LSQGQATDLAKPLQQGLAALGVSLSVDKQTQLLDYLALFAKWNKAYNLSAVRDINAMLGRHLLDSLSVLTYLEGYYNSNELRLIDVGTGGGLPGVPLAIARPDWQLSLLDSNGKKTRFLVEVVARLGLQNVTVLNQRVETLQPEPLFDAAISRAFASLQDMVNGCQQLVVESGTLWAMKGQFPDAEIAAMDPNWVLTRSHELLIPDEVGQRHLLQLNRA